MLLCSIKLYMLGEGNYLFTVVINVWHKHKNAIGIVRIMSS